MTPDMGTKNAVQEAVKATSSSLRDGMSLRRRYVVAIGAGAIAVLIAVAAVGGVALSRSMSSQEFAALSDAARRSALLVDRVLSERLRQVDLIAWESRIIDGAKKGTEASRKHGFPSMPIPALEERFRVERSQQVDDVALDYLLDLVPKLDIAEVILTDVYGFNAVVSLTKRGGRTRGRTGSPKESPRRTRPQAKPSSRSRAPCAIMDCVSAW
jgi:hypothetical protein